MGMPRGERDMLLFKTTLLKGQYFLFQFRKVIDYNCPNNVFRNSIVSMDNSIPVPTIAFALLIGIFG
mgnify:CR=1 FL=1